MQSPKNKDRLKIAVKLCGHCNPRTDMMETAAQLKKRAQEGEGLEFVFWAADKDADLLLILSACESACAERPDFDGPVIVATPETVDHWPVKEEDLCERIMEKINSKFC